jgi:hypothetical protein
MHGTAGEASTATYHKWNVRAHSFPWATNWETWCGSQKRELYGGRCLLNPVLSVCVLLHTSVHVVLPSLVACCCSKVASGSVTCFCSCFHCTRAPKKALLTKLLARSHYWMPYITILITCSPVAVRAADFCGTCFFVLLIFIGVEFLQGIMCKGYVYPRWMPGFPQIQAIFPNVSS